MSTFRYCREHSSSKLTMLTVPRYAARISALVIGLIGSQACTRPDAAGLGADDVPANIHESDANTSVGLVPQSRGEGSDSLQAMIERLAELEGSFDTGDVTGPLQFAGDRSFLRAFAQFGDSAVFRLVECMDRYEPAKATFNGKPVALGVMCYTALQSVAYYEHTDEHGDLTGEWAGYIDATASREEMLRAQNAWRKVIADSAYVLLPPPNF